MKTKLTLLALALGLAVTPVKAQVGNDWLNALSSTNLTIGTHALFDLTTKTAGGGIFAVYDLNNYVGGLVTLDYLNHQTFPSAAMSNCNCRPTHLLTPIAGSRMSCLCRMGLPGWGPPWPAKALTTARL
jgi:hypothetical protein